MASQKLIKETNLHDLLDGFLISQRQDIDAFSKGHLNEANLCKPKERKAYKGKWKASSGPIPRMRPKITLKQSIPRAGGTDEMEDTFTGFSLGTTVPGSKFRSVPSPVSDELSNVLVENMKLPDNMMPSKAKSKGWAQEDFRMTGSPHKQQSQSQLKSDNLAWFSRHQFLSSHLEAVTKRDQFSKLKEFEDRVLCKQEAMEQNVMSGVKAVEHHENKLRQDLLSLPYDDYGPNYHRLQVYSNTFDDLIKDSPTLGFMLKQIKKEYDDYVTSLLDDQRSSHSSLHDQMGKLTSRRISNPSQLQVQTDNVQYLEKLASKKLDENERLRQELRIELELAAEPEPETPKTIPKFRLEPELEIADKIQQLRAAILEKLDAMKALRCKLRTEHVPCTVVQHLEQCIKETEVEIQKLSSSKAFFDRSIEEMESELREAIETADTTERDARRVWKKVSAVKAQTRVAGGGVRGRGGGAKTPVSDSDEEDEESKWSWYIS